MMYIVYNVDHVNH